MKSFKFIFIIILLFLVTEIFPIKQIKHRNYRRKRSGDGDKVAKTVTTETNTVPVQDQNVIKNNDLKENIENTVNKLKNLKKLLSKKAKATKEKKRKGTGNWSPQLMAVDNEKIKIIDKNTDNFHGVIDKSPSVYSDFGQGKPSPGHPHIA